MSIRGDTTAYRNSLWELAQFEPWRVYYGAAVGFLTLLAIPALPVAIVIATVYLAHGRGLQLVLSLALIPAVAFAGWLWRQRRWERPVVRRLAEWHSSDPRQGEVGVSLAERDLRRAWIALMRAQLLPRFSRKQLGGLPDAPALDRYLAVALPMTRPPADFDAVAAMVRTALDQAGIRARVVGVDVGPLDRETVSHGS
jgi:hypothetical protein